MELAIHSLACSIPLVWSVKISLKNCGEGEAGTIDAAFQNVHGFKGKPALESRVRWCQSRRHPRRFVQETASLSSLPGGLHPSRFVQDQQGEPESPELRYWGCFLIEKFRCRCLSRFGTFTTCKWFVQLGTRNKNNRHFAASGMNDSSGSIPGFWFSSLKKKTLKQGTRSLGKTFRADADALSLKTERTIKAISYVHVFFPCYITISSYKSSIPGLWGRISSKTKLSVPAQHRLTGFRCISPLRSCG